jgi:hypothetical protein
LRVFAQGAKPAVGQGPAPLGASLSPPSPNGTYASPSGLRSCRSASRARRIDSPSDSPVEEREPEPGRHRLEHGDLGAHHARDLGVAHEPRHEVEALPRRDRGGAAAVDEDEAAALGDGEQLEVVAGHVRIVGAADLDVRGPLR